MNLMIKLKTNRNLIKEPRAKIINIKKITKIEISVNERKILKG